jgi:hypothetical protein
MSGIGGTYTLSTAGQKYVRRIRVWGKTNRVALFYLLELVGGNHYCSMLTFSNVLTPLQLTRDRPVIGS